MEDLSTYHQPIGDLFLATENVLDREPFQLSLDQVDFYHAHGYLAGVKVLNDKQIEALRSELDQLIDPAHPGRPLFYEYNSNESSDPSRKLFHALGAWRVAPGFHDLLWNPSFTVPAAQLLGGPVRFGTIRSSISPPIMEEW